MAEKVKHQFIRERNASDARLRGIEETFREYQQECKSKERELLKDLEKAYQQIKGTNNIIQTITAKQKICRQ